MKYKTESSFPNTISKLYHGLLKQNYRYITAPFRVLPDFFVIGAGKAHSIQYFVRKSFEYLGLNYKKYLKIDKKLIRRVKNKTLVADTKKAKKIFKFKPTTSLNKLVKIMIQNDLKIERDKKE